MLTPFERGVVVNLIADWLLQNDWMARNKHSYDIRQHGRMLPSTLCYWRWL